MKIANQQKLIIGVATLAIVALITTTIWSRPGFLYQPPSAAERQIAQDKQKQELEEYRKYLADIEADPRASQMVISKTIDSKVLSAQVTADLGATKPALTPRVDASRFKVNADTGRAAIDTYLNGVKPLLEKISELPADSLNSALGAEPDPIAARSLQSVSSNTISDLYNMPVPKPAVELHTSIIAALSIHGQFITDAVGSAATSVAPRGAARWTNTYPTYAAAQTQLANVNTAVQALGHQYGLFDDGEKTVQNGLVKTANAQVPVSVITNIPQWLELAIRQAVSTVILNYIKNQVLTWALRFDKDHTIANFLYYNNALTTKNTEDYLKKYATEEQGYDNVDRDMIKNLIPQFNCGRLDEEAFKKDVRAKVLTYLGFNPSALSATDISDPDYYSKLAKTATLRGDPSGQGYALWAQSLAAVTQGESEKSGILEQLSSGKKAGYSAQGAQRIVESVDLVSGKITSAINAMFNIGPTTAASGLTGAVAGILTSILQQLVVQGTVTLQEQTACIKAAVYNPVIPGDFTPSDGGVNATQITQCVANPDLCRELIFANPNGDIGVVPRQ